MALQNRSRPDGVLVAEPWRGDFMGNRGGKIHDPETRALTGRRWASRRWIICVTKFKNRQRTVMGEGYTELFFLDEVSALACGHRPCFECRREDANEFAHLWAHSFDLPARAGADEMDKNLHQVRLRGDKHLMVDNPSALPDGAMVVTPEGTFLAFIQGQALRWSGAGYERQASIPEHLRLLTPAPIVKILENGYKPKWHASAELET